ncbi:hypothetical protein GCM10009804_16540 [Kribbella hippodromi]|uniref:Na+/H+ antiporter MnhB subunit-related protein domain-containing protein n=1 Tax=Kribbella hippodromi TaxID=434347 RepID=A0ABN2CPK1_9ACTN
MNARADRRTIVGWSLAALTAVVLGAAAIDLPREHAALPEIARQALAVAIPDWRTTEPVNEVVYGTRAFDTFGETFLLLAAVVSVLLLARRREPRREYFGEETAGAEEQEHDDPHEAADAGEQKARAAESHEIGPGAGGGESGRDLDLPDGERVGTPAPEQATAMTAVIRVAVRLVLPLLGIAGCYLVLLGYSPGGGFPAGVVFLGLVLMTYAALGYRRVARVVRPGLLEVLELAGAALVIAVLAMGLVLAGSFSANWLPLAPEQTIRSGGILQAFSLAELIEVGTGLTIVIFTFLAMRHDWTPDEADERDDQPGDGRAAEERR